MRQGMRRDPGRDLPLQAGKVPDTFREHRQHFGGFLDWQTTRSTFINEVGVRLAICYLVEEGWRRGQG